MSLYHLQKQFQQYVRAGVTDFMKSVTGENRRFVKTRLAIYSDAYFLRLHALLSLDFPVLAQCLGKRVFAEVIAHYIDQYPSRHASARYIGSQLAEFLPEAAEALQTSPGAKTFLKQTGASSESWVQACQELAQFEWQLSATADAPDAPRLTSEDLAQHTDEAWPALVFHWHPSVRFLSLHSNAPYYSQARQLKKRAQWAWNASETQTWILWRGADLRSYYAPVETLNAHVCEMISKGMTFADMCERLSEKVGEAEAPTRVAGQVIQSIRQGWLMRSIP